MFKKKDDVKTFVVVISVCIICVVVALILNIKSNTDRLVAVDEYGSFFSNVNYVNNYINYIASGKSEAVYSLLYDSYIEENQITYDNVLEKVDNYSVNNSFGAYSMEVVQVGGNYIYYIKGKIYNNDYYGRSVVDENFDIILIVDFDNLSYSLFPIDDNYESKLNNIKKINIDSNNYNGVEKTEYINKEQICVIYLTDFINNLNNDVDKTYNLLSDDMKKVYSNVESYNEYVKQNSRNFSINADKCKVELRDDKRIYTIIDNKENTYVFTEESIMNYKVDFYLKES